MRSFFSFIAISEWHPLSLPFLPIFHASPTHQNAVIGQSSFGPGGLPISTAELTAGGLFERGELALSPVCRDAENASAASVTRMRAAVMVRSCALAMHMAHKAEQRTTAMDRWR